MKKIKNGLVLITSEQDDQDGSTSYPSLHAIEKCFAPIRHVQTTLEAYLTPAYCIILPMILKLKPQLQRLSSGINYSGTLKEPHPYTKWMTRITLKGIENISIHDVWVASSLLHPGYRRLSFMRNMSVRSSMMKKRGSYAASVNVAL